MNRFRSSFPFALMVAVLVIVVAAGCGGGSGSSKTSTPRQTVAQQTSPDASQENAEEPATSNLGEYVPSETAGEPGVNSEGEYEAQSAGSPEPVLASQGHKWNSRQLHQIDALVKKSSSKEFTFAVLSDNHRNYPVFKNVLSKIKKSGALFAIECGDMGQTGSKESFNTYLGNVSSFNKPLMVGIGNHDLLPSGSKMSNANFKEYFGRTYYAFNVGRSKFIMLDDANRRGWGATQTKWLEAQLARADDSKKFDHCFVFMHVPLLDPSHKGKGPGHGIQDANNEKQMKTVFDKHHVSVIFTGHVHGWFEGTWGKTQYVITGGAGGTLGGSDPSHFFHHYIEVTVKPGQHPSWRVVKLSKVTSSQPALVALAGAPPQRELAGIAVG